MYRAVDDKKKIKFYKKLSKYIINYSDYVTKKQEILKSLDEFMYDERKFLTILKKFCQVKVDYHKECDKLLNEASESIHLQLSKLDTYYIEKYNAIEQNHYNDNINNESIQLTAITPNDLSAVNLLNPLPEKKEVKLKAKKRSARVSSCARHYLHPYRMG